MSGRRPRKRVRGWMVLVGLAAGVVLGGAGNPGTERKHPVSDQWLALWGLDSIKVESGPVGRLYPPHPVTMELSMLPVHFMALAEISPDSTHALQFLADVAHWTEDGWALQQEDSWNVWLVDLTEGRARIILSPGMSACVHAAEWASPTRFTLYGTARDPGGYRLAVWSGDLDANSLTHALGPKVESFSRPPGDWTGWLAAHYHHRFAKR